MVAFCLFAISACADAPAADTVWHALGDPASLPSPAGPGSSVPNLAIGPHETVLMSWIEPTDDGDALRFATLEGAAWTAPQTITRSDSMFTNWADFPSIVHLPGGGLAAHWLQRSGESTYAYDVRISLSPDAGATWGAPIRPHDDGTQTEHGFVSLSAEADGSVTAVWLDGRNFAAAEGQPEAGAGSEMTLRAARLHADGTVSDAALLDSRICDCCQTSSARVGDTLLVAYRDRSPDEIRDIWSVRRDSTGWPEPVRVAEDNWMIPGCPVNGPAVSALDDGAAVAWFSLGADGVPRVKIVFSEDAGASFAAPIEIAAIDGDWTTLGRVDAEWIDPRTVVVVWLAANRERGEIRYRTVTRSGELGDVRVLGNTASSRSSGFPRMVRAGDRLIAARTIPGEPSQIVVTELPLVPVTE